MGEATRALQAGARAVRGRPAARVGTRNCGRESLAGRLDRCAYRPKRRPEVEIWTEDIEADNFTEQEICWVIRLLAERDDRITEFSLTAEELIAKRRESKKAVAAVAIELAESRGFPLSKVELDAELGRYAAQHPEYDGTTRRILVVAEHLYRLTVAHRKMRGRLRERERARQPASDHASGDPRDHHA